MLADFLDVDTRFEGVVEDFLRDELNYIVVKSWDAADEGLRLLRTDVDGAIHVSLDDSGVRWETFRGRAGRLLARSLAGAGGTGAASGQ